MRRILPLLLALLLAGCGDARLRQLRASMRHAQIELHRAQVDVLAGARLRNALETTGSPVDYLLTEPGGVGLGPFRHGQPEQAWDVVLSGGGDEWRIDGYGESLDRPLETLYARRE
ncbi:MAG: hypothetical protein IT479_14405 [Xanthomonadales bacterium]|nr:hypothetical protein [Xanthomonadales bacterium]MCC6594453.1 hypothetical protein [Xanthomonadales bacterium]MCE7932488.1 hypothetical protein [Xanthomonadales bacterium PRO6]